MSYEVFGELHIETPGHKSAGRRLYQFSIRDLLQFTFFFALLCGAIAFGRNHVFLMSHPRIGTVAGLMPIVAVWMVYWFRAVTPRALRIGSGVLFGVSFIVVALGWENSPIPGGMAFIFSFSIFSPDGFKTFVRSLVEWNEENLLGWIASIAGSLTNAAFLSGFALLFASIKFQKALQLAHKAARWGTLFAIGLLVPLWLSGDLNGVFIGYGFWAASLLALALGTKDG